MAFSYPRGCIDNNNKFKNIQEKDKQDIHPVAASCVAKAANYK